MEVMDWKLVGFLAITLLQEHYLTAFHKPKVYYWSLQEFRGKSQ
jgi:hypothetical protein